MLRNKASGYIQASDANNEGSNDTLQHLSATDKYKCKHILPNITEKQYTTFLICLATACLFADQNLMAPNLTQIAQEFNFTKLEADQKLGGEIALALFLVGGPISLTVGYLSDKFNRRKLYAFVVLLGEIGCLLTVLVTEYWHLFFLRALTGIALGGALPLVFSMLSDMYKPKERNQVSAIVGVAMTVGTLSGQLMSGAVGPSSGWRVPFVVVAVPSCIIALLFYFTAMDPERGSCDADDYNNSSETSSSHSYSEEISWVKIKEIFALKSNRLMFLQGIPGCMPWGMIGVYLNDYLYVDKKAPSVLDATTIMTIFGVGGLCGQILGGWWGQYLYNKRKEKVAYLMGLSTILGIIPMLLLVNLPFSYATLGPIAFIGGACASITGPNVRAVLQNCNLPETRGTVFALFALTDDLGKAFGPYLISAFVAGFGRTTAFNVATFMWLICGILLLSLRFTMRKDEDRIILIVTSKKNQNILLRTESSNNSELELIDIAEQV